MVQKLVVALADDEGTAILHHPRMNQLPMIGVLSVAPTIRGDVAITDQTVLTVSAYIDADF